MTEAEKQASGRCEIGQASSTGDLELELLGLRLNGAQLGAMLSVSRQAVSAAVKRGTIAPPGPDGLFDARRAVREWMNNSDPARVRARALKPGAEALSELRQRAQALAGERDALRAELEVEREWGDKREEAAAFRAEMEAAQGVCRFTNALAKRFGEAGAAHGAGWLDRWLDELAAVECYGRDLDEYRRECAEDEAAAIVAGCPEVPTESAD